MTNNLNVNIEVSVHDEQPMVLHEELATGEFDGSEFRLLRSISGGTMYIQFEEKVYEVDTRVLLRDVLTRVRKKGAGDGDET